MSPRSCNIWRRILLGLALLIMLLLVIELLFRNRVLQHSLASQAYKQGRHSVAEKAWNRSLDKDDGDPIPEGSLGKLHYKQGDYAKAQQRLNDGIQEKVQNPVTHYDLGNTLYRQDKLDEALEQYKSAMLLDPKDQDAKANYELVLLRKGYQPPPPPREQEGEKQPQDKPQPDVTKDQQEQFKNTLDALDQKEASDRNTNRKPGTPAKEGKWW